MTVTRGVSEAAEFVLDRTFAVQNRLGASFTFGRQQAMESLSSVYDECKQSDWDGFDALPISQEILRNAYCVIESLPLGMPMPSVGAEPDGNVTLEWHRSPSRTISVSVDANEELHYAVLVNGGKHFGQVTFLGELPKVIREFIYLVMND